LIVFAHGFDSNLNGYQALLTQWAASGYVVAAPLFPLTVDDAAGGPDLADFANQPADLSFVITQVLDESARSGDPLSGLVDPHHIGAAGHSLGGVTILGLVANTCCTDSRVDAAVVMSGDAISFPTGSVDFGSAPPLLFVHGSADPAVPYSSSIIAFNSAHAPKGLLTIRGGDHGSPVRASGIAFPSVVRTTVGFFNRYLKGQSGGVADLASDVSEGNTTLTFAYQPGQNVQLPVPGTIARHRAATVEPVQHLVDGQILRVDWKGFAPGVSVNVLECSKSPPTAADDCDLQTAKLLQADPTGSGSLQFPIHTGTVGAGTCSASHPGCVVVVNEGGSQATSASVIVPVSFAP
jgi:dienelactone hydrolase